MEAEARAELQGELANLKPEEGAVLAMLLARLREMEGKPAQVVKAAKAPKAGNDNARRPRASA
jgi:hypothetical protein